MISDITFSPFYYLIIIQMISAEKVRDFKLKCVTMTDGQQMLNRLTRANAAFSQIHRETLAWPRNKCSICKISIFSVLHFL